MTELTIVEMLVNGIFVGMGTSIGAYLSARYVTSKMDNMEKRVKEDLKEFRKDQDSMYEKLKGMGR